jgi:DnaJ-class molecular chaperone
MTCPRCDGAGVVDTSPPGVEDAPWLQTDTDCPRCGGSGEIPDHDTEEN